MESWLPYFVIIASVAIVLQAAMLIAMFFALRESLQRITKITTELHDKLDPILTKTNYLLEDSRTRITSMVADWAEFSQIARNQAVKFDRVVSEGMELLRVQIVRADQILTGVIETADDVGTQFRKSILGPVTQVAAVIRGVKAGLDFFTGPKKSNSERARAQSDEELFI
jgi:type IV secretory pathway VirB2 component (pilin)